MWCSVCRRVAFCYDSRSLAIVATCLLLAFHAFCWVLFSVWWPQCPMQAMYEVNELVVREVQEWSRKDFFLIKFFGILSSMVTPFWFLGCWFGVLGSYDKPETNQPSCWNGTFVHFRYIHVQLCFPWSKLFIYLYTLKLLWWYFWMTSISFGAFFPQLGKLQNPPFQVVFQFFHCFVRLQEVYFWDVCLRPEVAFI